MAPDWMTANNAVSIAPPEPQYTDSPWDRIRRGIGTVLMHRAGPAAGILGALLAAPRTPSDVYQEGQQRWQDDYRRRLEEAKLTGAGLSNKVREGQIAAQEESAKQRKSLWPAQELSAAQTIAKYSQPIAQKLFPNVPTEERTVPGIIEPSEELSSLGFTPTPMKERIIPVAESLSDAYKKSQIAANEALVKERAAKTKQIETGKMSTQRTTAMQDVFSMIQKSNPGATDEQLAQQALDYAMKRSHGTKADPGMVEKHKRMSKELFARLSQQNAEIKAGEGTMPENDKRIGELYNQLGDLEDRMATGAAPMTASKLGAEISWSDLKK